MSRRSSNGEQEFGSDSFLDIIANIVGILIILIVVAGLRVANQPAFTEPMAEALPAPVEAISPPTVVEVAPPDLMDHRATLHSNSPDVDAAIAELAIRKATLEELESELQQLQASLTVVDENAVTDLVAEIAEANKQIGDLQRQLTDTVLEQQQFQTTLAALDQQQRNIRQHLAAVERSSRQLQEVLDARPEPTAASNLKHKILPVSHAASQQHVHFLLHNGRIAQVPLDKLGERASRMARQRMDILRKVGTVTVVAGPENGFRMEFTAGLQRDPRIASIGTMNMQLTYSFQVRPTDSVPTESVEDALILGSRFRQLLESTEPGSEVTIWLYDTDRAFGEFAKLRDLAYRLGLRVAAWPLQTGAVIQGGSGGFQSSAQ